MIVMMRMLTWQFRYLGSLGPLGVLAPLPEVLLGLPLEFLDEEEFLPYAGGGLGSFTEYGGGLVGGVDGGLDGGRGFGAGAGGALFGEEEPPDQCIRTPIACRRG